MPDASPKDTASSTPRGISLSVLVEGLPDAFCCLDSEWRFSYVSLRMAELLGMSSVALLGKDLRQQCPDLVVALQQHLAPDLPTTEQPPVRLRYIWPGRDLCFDIRVRPVEGGMLLHLRDITGERRAHEELRKAHELLLSIINGTTDAVFTKDLQGRYLFINETGARAIGHTIEDVIGRDDWQIFPPASAAAAIANDQAVLSSGQMLTYEEVQQTPEGSRVWLATKAVLRDSHGKAAGLFGISRDITRHKQVEEELKLSVERLRLCMEMAQVGTWDWDLRTRRIRWSDNAATLFGEAPEDSYEGLLHRVLAEDRDQLAHQVAIALEERTHFDVRFRVYVPNGAPRWLRVRGRVLSEGEQAVWMLGVVMDVAREKQAEEESRRAADFQEQLIGVVSHDIRSPLGAIISWARLMSRGGTPPEEQQRTFRRITSAALRIERLTRLLLDFARARLGGGITIEPRRMDLHELFEKVSHEFQVAYPDRAVLYAREGEAAIGTWDPDRLAQVLSNLMENALKHSPPDTPVQLTTRGLKDQVELEIHNQGKPIPPELLPHLFEPFRRGPQATKTAKTSYGLGLYIVQEIVLAHGGTIEVRSSSEQGTTFTVCLPRVPPSVLALLRRPAPIAPQRT